jgi:hypothetical protein
VVKTGSISYTAKRHAVDRDALDDAFRLGRNGCGRVPLRDITVIGASP